MRVRAPVVDVERDVVLLTADQRLQLFGVEDLEALARHHLEQPGLQRAHLPPAPAVEQVVRQQVAVLERVGARDARRLAAVDERHLERLPEVLLAVREGELHRLELLLCVVPRAQRAQVAVQAGVVREQVREAVLAAEQAVAEVPRQRHVDEHAVLDRPPEEAPEEGEPRPRVALLGHGIGVREHVQGLGLGVLGEEAAMGAEAALDRGVDEVAEDALAVAHLLAVRVVLEAHVVHGGNLPRVLVQLREGVLELVVPADAQRRARRAALHHALRCIMRSSASSREKTATRVANGTMNGATRSKAASFTIVPAPPPPPPPPAPAAAAAPWRLLTIALNASMPPAWRPPGPRAAAAMRCCCLTSARSSLSLLVAEPPSPSASRPPVMSDTMVPCVIAATALTACGPSTFSSVMCSAGGVVTLGAIHSCAGMSRVLRSAV
mmetsp:Transcript_44883/g.138473  ORF Transcript_44883/g.138473 Transcript_44883/m.138473 type:complete len:437 (-) Transcript_44883:783-2093(-)